MNGDVDVDTTPRALSPGNVLQLRIVAEAATQLAAVNGRLSKESEVFVRRTNELRASAACPRADRHAGLA
jgi:hypothetical protein